jgi:hypothetical protein
LKEAEISQFLRMTVNLSQSLPPGTTNQVHGCKSTGHLALPELKNRNTTLAVTLYTVFMTIFGTVTAQNNPGMPNRPDHVRSFHLEFF